MGLDGIGRDGAGLDGTRRDGGTGLDETGSAPPLPARIFWPYMEGSDGAGHAPPLKPPQKAAPHGNPSGTPGPIEAYRETRPH